MRCSHASAVGPIDEDQRFYLESRGVPTDMADRLIALGFLDEVLERLPAAGLVAVVAPRARRQAGRGRSRGCPGQHGRERGGGVSLGERERDPFPRDKLTSGQATHLDGGPDGVCLVRIGDDFYAMADRCSHANVSLSEGDVDVEDADRVLEARQRLLADRRPTPVPAGHQAGAGLPGAVRGRRRGGDGQMSELVIEALTRVGRRPGDPAGHRPDGRAPARSTRSWDRTARARAPCRTC